MTKEVMQQALEALEESQTDNDTMEFWDRKIKAITAIKEALAQPPQPVQRQPLTDEEIQSIWDVAAGAIPGWLRHIAYARAIEAAHGIKEGT